MLIYKFINNSEIYEVKIELINNSFVNFWKRYITELYQRVPNIEWYITRFNYNERWLTERDIIEFLARVYHSFLFFRKKNVEKFENEISRIEYLFKNPQYLNQNDLNVWHRHFTDLEFTYSLHPHKTPPNTLTLDLYEHIHDVNQYVHKCEGFTYADCARRQLFPNSPMYTVQFTNANHMSYFSDNDHNRQVWNNDTPKYEDNFYDTLNENSDYTVWLHEDIIGKDQMKAWLDHDDLKQFDITGNKTITPNLSFDPHKLYHRIIQNQDFRKESLESGKKIDRLPVGNIIDIDNVNFEKILGGKVVSIELDRNLLWNYNY